MMAAKKDSAGNKTDAIMRDILPYLLPQLRLAVAAASLPICEIRMRAEQPLMVYDAKKGYYCGTRGICPKEQAYIVTCEDIRRQVSSFCHNSQYAHQDTLKQGYITLAGGHRIGFGGTAAIVDGSVCTLRDFSCINVRIAREIFGCADAFLPYIIQNNTVFNTLFVAPPGVGKTTVLRDVARQLSERFKITLVDERSEIAAAYGGRPQLAVGLQTDVLDGFPKAYGIGCALRALSPQIIITDEIGTQEDKEAILQMLKSGVKIITSMHGGLTVSEGQRSFFSLFERVIFLKRESGSVEVASCITP